MRALVLGLAILALVGCGASDSGDDQPPHDSTAPADIVATDLSQDVPQDLSPEDLVEPDTAPVSGEFMALTYNVAGLPEGLSKSNPEQNHPQISPLLNDFYLVLVQEDFAYHDLLAQEAMHPHQSLPYDDPETLGDGLNIFSFFEFEPALHREPWEVCSGTFDKANDCLTLKGFAYAPITLSPGLVLHVYDFHMDAGGHEDDQNARRSQALQLLAHMETLPEGAAVLVGADTNLQMSRPFDVETLDLILEEAGLTDSCRHLDCGDERIDRVLFRAGSTLSLEPLSWEVAEEFVDQDGEQLSDHKAVKVRFRFSEPAGR